MQISARLANRQSAQQVWLSTAGREHSLAIPAKQDGSLGSSVNGGELLFLALATCYCNDLYREAGKRGLVIDSVEVEVSGDFGAEGEPAQNIQYTAFVRAKAPEEEIQDLLRFTDTVAEIHNTVRRGCPVVLREGRAHDSR